MTERAVALYEQELLRTRWRRRVGLEAVNDDLFALRGEPQPSDSLAGRILILPRDPECAFIDFDEAFRDWYANPCPDPVTGGSTNFGNATRTLSNCAVLYESDYRDESNPWLGFFVLHRSGALDVALSERFGRAVDNSKFFHLVALVGRFWAAATRYSAFVERWKLEGPFEISLGLRGTQGAQLGGVGEGWLDPLRERFGAEGLPRCVEPHLLMRDELEEWPTGQERELTFRVGAWIEDAWGMKERRLIARAGEYEGAFDARHYP